MDPYCRDIRPGNILIKTDKRVGEFELGDGKDRHTEGGCNVEFAAVLIKSVDGAVYARRECNIGNVLPLPRARIVNINGSGLLSEPYPAVRIEKNCRNII